MRFVAVRREGNVVNKLLPGSHWTFLVGQKLGVVQGFVYTTTSV